MITQIFNNEVLNLIFNSVSNGIIITDSKGKIIWVNQGFTNLTGYSIEEVKDKNPRILKSNLHKKEFYEKMWNTISNGDIWHGEVINKRKDGTLYYEEMIITPIKNGKISHYVAIKNDITSKKDIEIKLKKEQELLRSVMRTVPIPLAISNIEGNIVDVNRAWEDTVGWTREEVIKYWSENLNLWIDLNLKNKAIKEMQETGKIESFEIPLRRKDGKIIDFLFWRAQGEDYLFTSGFDITERKEQEERYKMVIDDALDGINVCELNKKTHKRILKFCNDKYVEMSGYTREELFAHENINNLRTRVKIKEPTHENGEKISGICSWNRPDKKENFYEYYASIYDHVDFIEIFGIDRDITERIESERKLEVLAKQLKTNNKILKSKNEELNYFAHIATHDLKEPLRITKLYIESLKNDLNDMQLSEKSKQDMNFIIEASDQMTRTLSSLLEFSRASKKNFKKEKVDMNDCVQRALSILNYKIKELEIEIEVCDLGSVICDKTMMSQVFQNLISNAIKFNNKQKPKIKVYIKKSRAENTVFIIEDNGIGIEKEFINQIFIPFKKLHSTDVYPGTGIGLSICKKIIEKHDGNIWVESKKNKGSIFKFILNGS